MTYILPFNNIEVVITQGYNGPWTHRKIRANTDQSYSSDFALPVGTEVTAAREGIVKLVYDMGDSVYRGYDFSEGSKFIANMVNISLDDGTIASYQHFEKGSVSSRLKEGDFVKQSQVIGRTGLSGWVGPIPHLHFMVYEEVPFQLNGLIVRAM